MKIALWDEKIKGGFEDQCLSRKRIMKLPLSKE